MNKNFEKWIDKQTTNLFKGAGSKPGKKVAKHFSLILALPFFFVPLLIVGFAVADAGNAMQKHTVAFLRSKEVKPANPVRVVVHQKAKARKSIVVTHTATPSDFEAHAKP